MSRRKIRESTLQLIFEYEFLHKKNELSLNDFLDENQFDAEEKSVVITNYNGIVEKESELEEIITKYLVDYKIDRIYKVDLCILKLAVYEMKFLNETPAVVINEAVEISKKYSTDKSFGFINGILASVVKGEF